MRNPKFRPAGYLKAQLAPCVLLALCLALSQKTLVAQATQPSPKSFAASHSVVVFGPNSPLFDSALENDFPGGSGVTCFQAVEPLLAIIHNNTQRVVKAYAVKWVVTMTNGSTETVYLSAVNGPLDDGNLTGQETVLGRGGTGMGTALISPFFHWSKKRFPVLLSGDAVVGTFCALSQQVPVVQEPLVIDAQTATSVHVTLDSVIFGDGVSVGPDTSKLYERFQAAQKAEVDEGEWVVNELNSGTTDQELRDVLSRQIYSGRDATGTDDASLYTAGRGREATRLLGALSELSPTGFHQVATSLAGQKVLTLTKQTSP